MRSAAGCSADARRVLAGKAVMPIPVGSPSIHTQSPCYRHSANPLGLGGQAGGGDHRESSYGGLVNIKALNIASNNAGNGGEASSGSALGGGLGC
jgi:hypothetical protein